ncbi:hypothetical protein PGT21_034601 [Puccinia graminis f. sp. tritici]|uniref:Uncharacterized protein n=1 Tax=Puccinia graminis f. sp. tritici TaxID=56615 RepID=A0A5B0LKC3_PUCGR|nr:hypothetical protein PGTUg99_022628 [Puccinia graminis f. sp. tritici]KAA1095016.1 hypothetical protein PGT21_034601 [Puccinia graminis f. sp. tritici]
MNDGKPHPTFELVPTHCIGTNPSGKKMTARPGSMAAQQAGLPDALLASNIPLIRAPGTWLPKPIACPSDLHPLPEDVTAYFVYPYTLEPSSIRYLHGLSSHPTNWETTLQSTQTYLEDRRLRKEAERIRIELEKEQSRLDSLRLIAPGWNGAMESILGAPSTSAPPPTSSAPSTTPHDSHPS